MIIAEVLFFLIFSPVTLVSRLPDSPVPLVSPSVSPSIYEAESQVDTGNRAKSSFSPFFGYMIHFRDL